MTKKEKEAVAVLCHKVTGVMNRLSDEERRSLRESISLVYGEKPTELDNKYADIPEIKHPEGCEYCHEFFNEGENSELMNGDLYLNRISIADVSVGIELDRLMVKVSNNDFDILTDSIRINYCPMCGKKIEYNDRVKVTNTEFDRDDPEFLMSLDLSVRSHNCLSRARVLSINDFCDLSAEDLMNIRNLGRHSYVEIAYALREHGVIISDILKAATAIKGGAY